MFILVGNPESYLKRHMQLYCNPRVPIMTTSADAPSRGFTCHYQHFVLYAQKIHLLYDFFLNFISNESFDVRLSLIFSIALIEWNPCTILPGRVRASS